MKRLLGSNIHNKEDVDGMCTLFESGGGSTVIWIWTLTKDVSVLVHEAVHAAMFTFDKHGVHIETNNDELLAYTVDMLIRKTLQKKK